jgi:hypothetical protein
MDDKTAELRDIFVEATGSDTVTERQEEGPGSLASSDRSTGPRLRELLATMREQYDFSTDLDDDALETVVRRFYEEADDDAIADELGVDGKTVFRARMDLHLVRPADRDAPFAFEELRRLVVAGADVDDCVAALHEHEADDDEGGDDAADAEIDRETVARYRRVAEADVESIRANDRFRDEFEELLTDADLSTQLARDAREDGLREATEDIETDVSL